MLVDLRVHRWSRVGTNDKEAAKYLWFPSMIILHSHSICFNNQTDSEDETEGMEGEGL